MLTLEDCQGLLVKEYITCENQHNGGVHPYHVMKGNITYENQYNGGIHPSYSYVHTHKYMCVYMYIYKDTYYIFLVIIYVVDILMSTTTLEKYPWPSGSKGLSKIHTHIHICYDSGILWYLVLGGREEAVWLELVPCSESRCIQMALWVWHHPKHLWTFSFGGTNICNSILFPIARINKPVHSLCVILREETICYVVL